MIATIAYLLKIKDRIKAIVILTVIGMATLFLSVLRGGSITSFAGSYIVLGFMTCYFDKVIIVCCSSVHIVASVILFLINPAYIVGSENTPFIGGVFIVFYIFLATILYYITNSGNNLIKMANENAMMAQEQQESIQKHMDTAKLISQNLNEHLNCCKST